MANRPRITSSVNSVIAKAGRPRGAAISTATTARPSRLDQRIASCLLAEQATGPYHQHQQHDEVHKGKREVGEVVVAEHLDKSDQQRADQRAEEAAHAADDDDDKGIN